MVVEIITFKLGGGGDFGCPNTYEKGLKKKKKKFVVIDCLSSPLQFKCKSQSGVIRQKKKVSNGKPPTPLSYPTVCFTKVIPKTHRIQNVNAKKRPFLHDVQSSSWYPHTRSINWVPSSCCDYSWGILFPASSDSAWI